MTARSDNNRDDKKQPDVTHDRIDSDRGMVDLVNYALFTIGRDDDVVDMMTLLASAEDSLSHKR